MTEVEIIEVVTRIVGGLCAAVWLLIGIVLIKEHNE